MKNLGIKESGGVASIGNVVEVPCSDFSLDTVYGTYESAIKSVFFDTGEDLIRSEINIFVNLNVKIPASPTSYSAGNLKYKGNNMSPVYGCWGGVYGPGAMSFAINAGGSVYFYSHYDVFAGKLICFTATLYFTRQHLVDIGLLS